MGPHLLRSRQVPRADLAAIARKAFSRRRACRARSCRRVTSAASTGAALAFDSERQLVIAAVNHVPMVVTLVPRDQFDAMHVARTHGRIRSSQRRPARPTACAARLLASPFGLPCTAPPWGTLAAVDLRRNAIRWQVMLGSTRDMTPWFVPSPTLGMPNMGGPIVTDGGLAFIGAATDNYLRAFDIDTGRELWKGRLPAGGQATPMSYEVERPTVRGHRRRRSRRPRHQARRLRGRFCAARVKISPRRTPCAPTVTHLRQPL